MNANIAKAIRNAEAYLLGRNYNRPLHPQLVKAMPAKAAPAAVAQPRLW
jgi:hypothetical protein